MMEIKNEILPAIAVVIFNEEGQVLLQRRADTGKWCVISGHVEFGETVEQAVLREISEETGLEAEIVRLIGIYSSPIHQTYKNGSKRTQYVTNFFEAVLKENINPDFINTETISLQFFPIANLPVDMDQINPFWLEDALASGAGIFIR